MDNGSKPAHLNETNPLFDSQYCSSRSTAANHLAYKSADNGETNHFDGDFTSDVSPLLCCCGIFY